jgi:hypothetical protein
VSNNIHQSKGSNCSYNINGEDVKDVEDDEELQLAKRPASLRCNSQPESQNSSSLSPTGDKEPTSNTGAAYQELPMRGFFKLTTIKNKVRYSIEFSLEDVQQLCAAAFPLHTSSAGSNASFSAQSPRRAQPFSSCAQAEKCTVSEQAPSIYRGGGRLIHRNPANYS